MLCMLIVYVLLCNAGLIFGGICPFFSGSQKVFWRVLAGMISDSIFNGIRQVAPTAQNG